MKDLQSALQQRQAQGLYRRRRILDGPQGRHITLDGQRLLNFCSNDYLGLASHPKLIESLQQAAQQYGVGSGSAHLVNGHSRAHHELEDALAEFTGYPRALLFSTGYMANLAVAQSLCGPQDSIIEDRLNHASLLDAAQLSGGRLLRYLHCDCASLATKLARCTTGEKLVSSDAVFSMDGDQLDIQAWQSACHDQGAWLMLDDAHGFGVLGDQGRGSLSQQQVKPDSIHIYMATLGKALGTAGAFVAGSEDLVEYLIQTARSYIYTTAMPAALAASSLTSLRLLQQEPERQQQLHDNIAYFRLQARSLTEQYDCQIMPSTTAIQPLLIGDSLRCSQLSQQLFDNGCHVAAIRPPTVPQNTARLRITLRADHHRDDIDQLINTLAQFL